MAGPMLDARLQAFLAIGISAGIVEKWESQVTGLKAQAEAAKAGEILLYGPIVDQQTQAFYSFFGDEDMVVSNRSFRADLNALSGDVVVRINSPGGDVHEASGIQTAMIERRNAGSKVAVTVDGLAASAASMVMISGDDVKMAPMATVMIHEPHATLFGTAEEFEAMASFLARMNGEVAALYAARMGISTDEALAVMRDGTEYTATEAVEANLADSIIELPAPASGSDVVAKVLQNQNRRLAALSALGVL